MQTIGAPTKMYELVSQYMRDHGLTARQWRFCCAQFQINKKILDGTFGGWV